MKISGFQQDKVLGEGSYGKVYKTHRLNDNQVYAIKIVDLKKLTFHEIEDTVNEIRLMASVTSPFIISFYEAFAEENKKQICIVTEYAKIGDLRHLIERRKLKNRFFSEEQVWRFLLEILEGLQILHSCGVVHRDLKSANILISAPDLVKIGDLGIATVLHKHKFSKEMAKTQIGTPLYLAPEVWLHFPYDQKCDIWSLGVLLYEIMTFNFPFDGRTQADLQRNICCGRYIVPRSTEKMYSKELILILRKLLMVDPNDRPSVDDLLKMPSVKSHMSLLDPFLQTDLYRNSSMNDIEMEGGRAKLLETIHVPRVNYRYGRNSVNLSNLNLPTQKYNKRQPSILPIEERIRVKNGVPFHPCNRLSELSTPDITLIADQDLWTANRSIRNRLNSARSISSSQLIRNNNACPNRRFHYNPQFNVQIDPNSPPKRSNSSSNLISQHENHINMYHPVMNKVNNINSPNNIVPRPARLNNMNNMNNIVPRLNQLNNIFPPSPIQRNNIVPRLNRLNNLISPSPSNQQNNLYSPSPIIQRNKAQLNNLIPRLKQHQQLFARENNVNADLKNPIPPIQRRVHPAMVDHFNQSKQSQKDEPRRMQPVQISPRIIPTRYAYLYKPIQNNLNQDPRWRRKQPTLKRIRDSSSLSGNQNNIFFRQQKDVPWWFGQELQPSPIRKN